MHQACLVLKLSCKSWQCHQTQEVIEPPTIKYLAVCGWVQTDQRPLQVSRFSTPGLPSPSLWGKFQKQFEAGGFQVPFDIHSLKCEWASHPLLESTSCRHHPETRFIRISITRRLIYPPATHLVNDPMGIFACKELYQRNFCIGGWGNHNFSIRNMLVDLVKPNGNVRENQVVNAIQRTFFQVGALVRNLEHQHAIQLAVVNQLFEVQLFLSVTIHFRNFLLHIILQRFKEGWLIVFNLFRPIFQWQSMNLIPEWQCSSWLCWFPFDGKHACHSHGQLFHGQGVCNAHRKAVEHHRVCCVSEMLHHQLLQRSLSSFGLYILQSFCDLFFFGSQFWSNTWRHQWLNYISGPKLQLPSVQKLFLFTIWQIAGRNLGEYWNGQNGD